TNGDSWYWQSNMAQLPAEVSTQPEQSGFFTPKKSPIRSQGAYRAFVYEVFYGALTHMIGIIIS
ncbi:hypothetical protein, partial [Escherichia coli]